jgi:hypothetical protein
MFTGPRAGIVEFLPLCDTYIEGMAKANAKSKATYRSNFADPRRDQAARRGTHRAERL